MLPFYKSSLSGQIFDALIVVDSFEKAVTIALPFKSSIHIIKNSKQRFIFIEGKNVAVVSSYGSLTELKKVESNKNNLVIERAFFKNSMGIKTKDISNNILELSKQSRRVVFVVDSSLSMNSMLSLVAKDLNLVKKAHYVRPTFLTEVVENLNKKRFVKRLDALSLKHFELEDVFQYYVSRKNSESKILESAVNSLLKGKLENIPVCVLEIKNNKLELPMNALPEEIISSLDLSLVKSKLNVLANVHVSSISEDIIQVSQKAPYLLSEFLYGISLRFNMPMKEVYNVLLSLYEKGMINSPLEKINLDKYKRFVKVQLKENFLNAGYTKDLFLVPNLNLLRVNLNDKKKLALEGVESLVFDLIKNRFLYAFAKPCSGVVAVFDFSVSTLFSESEMSFEKTLLVDVSCSHKNLFNLFNIEEGDYKARIIFKYVQNAVEKQTLFEVLSSALKDDPIITATLINLFIKNFRDNGQFISYPKELPVGNLKSNKNFLELISYFNKAKLNEKSLYKALKIILNLTH